MESTAAAFPGVKAVSLDVGGTLITPWPSVGHVYSEMARRHGYGTIAPATIADRFAIAWSARKGFTHAGREWRNLVNDTFSGLVAGEPSDEFFQSLYAHFATPEPWHVFPDVQPALEDLRAMGLKLAVVSNWDERLRPLLRALKLDRYFDSVSISIEVGATKPSARIFEHAAQALRLPQPAILHVGDTASEDVEGALEAGFHALLIDRVHRTTAPGVIQTLGQLPGLLEKQL